MTNDIKIQDGRLDEFFQKSPNEQRFCYFYKRDYDKDVFLRLVETEKNVILSLKEKSIAFSGDHFFISSKELGVFNYTPNPQKRKEERKRLERKEIIECIVSNEIFII